MKRSAFLLLTYILISCGPSAEQKTAIRLQVERIQLLKDSLETIGAMKEGLENRLIVYRANHEAAKDKMNTIKGYQFLRTVAEREEQVRNQFIVIEELENEIKKLSQEIDENNEASIRLKNELNELQSTL